MIKFIVVPYLMEQDAPSVPNKVLFEIPDECSVELRNELMIKCFRREFGPYDNISVSSDTEFGDFVVTDDEEFNCLFFTVVVDSQ